MRSGLSFLLIYYYSSRRVASKTGSDPTFILEAAAVGLWLPDSLLLTTCEIAIPWSALDCTLALIVDKVHDYAVY